MTTAELRQRARKRISQLSPERLRVADDFLAYLTEREDNKATKELSAIPGFREAYADARVSVAEGDLTALEDLRRKY